MQGSLRNELEAIEGLDVVECNTYKMLSDNLFCILGILFAPSVTNNAGPVLSTLGGLTNLHSLNLANNNLKGEKIAPGGCRSS